MYFFLKKGGTLEQGAITYSANHFFSWVHVETCLRDPKEHQGTPHVKSWGGYLGTTLCSQPIAGVHVRHAEALARALVKSGRIGRVQPARLSHYTKVYVTDY